MVMDFATSLTFLLCWCVGLAGLAIVDWDAGERRGAFGYLGAVITTLLLAAVFLLTMAPDSWYEVVSAPEVSGQATLALSHR